MKNLGVRFFVIAALSVSSTIFGQVQEGRIVGTVYDPQRSVVPGASVMVTDLGTNVARRVTTGAGGDYVVTPLNPGSYSVSATSAGFQTTTRSGIDLTVGAAMRLDIELRIGDAASVVSVSAE